jgi:replicative DNA helicase/DNA-binding transcriptional ArsR family regulator
MPENATPFSREAEMALLGAVLLDDNSYKCVADFLSPTDFFEKAHQRIFEVFGSLIRDGRKATVTTIRPFLSDLNLAGMDFDQYMRHLACEATTVVNAKDFGRTIHELSLRRDLLSLGEQIRRDACHADLDADLFQQIEKIERDLGRLKSSLNGSPSALRVTRVNDVEPEAVTWVWPGRLARGHMTILAGAPGDGKSQISVDATARITTTDVWPDGGRAPLGNVIMLSAEDNVKDVIRPRLEAAAADLDRVHVVEAMVGKDGKERTFDLQTDLLALRRLVTEIGDVALVIIDPITSYMGSKIDSHRTTDVRSVLEPLARFADEVGVAVLAISHPPKAAQGKAINSVTGSLAFVAAARMVFITSEEPETERRLLLSVKNNLGAKAPGIGYRMEQRIVSKGIVGSHVVWDSAPVTVTADEAIRHNPDGGGKEADAREFILDQLSAGTMSYEALKEVADREGINPATLRRARDKLKDAGKIIRTKVGFKGGWEWSVHELAHGAQDERRT